jgi:hypothetical protein
MIVLLGVTLALSIFLISSIASELSNLSPTVPEERTSSLLPEFINIRNSFGLAFNYNLVNISFNTPDTPNMIFYGKYGKYTSEISLNSFSKPFLMTVDLFDKIEMQYYRDFSAVLQRFYYSHLTDEGHVYLVTITLSLMDNNNMIKQTVTYPIVINEKIYTV